MIPQLSVFEIDFIQGDETYDETNPETLVGTYWYDPVEFNNKVFCYMMYTLPLLFEIKKKLKESLLNKC